MLTLKGENLRLQPLLSLKTKGKTCLNRQSYGERLDKEAF